MHIKYCGRNYTWSIFSDSLSGLKNRSEADQAGKPHSGGSQNKVSVQANLQVMPELKFGLARTDFGSLHIRQRLPGQPVIPYPELLDHFFERRVERAHCVYRQS